VALLILTSKTSVETGAAQGVGHDHEEVSTAMERLTYTVTEVAALLGISRASAYELVRSGEIPALHFGRRIVIPRVALEELLGWPVETATSTPPHQQALT
jgi:excisionase family DNA binding protein